MGCEQPPQRRRAPRLTRATPPWRSQRSISVSTAPRSRSAGSRCRDGSRTARCRGKKASRAAAYARPPLGVHGNLHRLVGLDVHSRRFAREARAHSSSAST